MGVDFWCFGADCAVAVAELVSFFTDECNGFAEEYFGVYSFKFIAFDRGKMVSDVTHIGCAKDCIAKGVNEYVGIAVSIETESFLLTFRKQDSPEPEVSPGGTCMYIVSESYSHYFLLLIRSLMPARSNPSVKRRVWSSGLEAAVPIT